MFKLRRYLKPFATLLVTVIVLLFIQAMSDLNLPNYMSNIVNVGLQQSGVEESSPNAISEEGMRFIRVLVSDSDRLLLEENYSLMSQTDTNATGKTYQSLYPDMSDKIYIKNTTDEEAADKLDKIFGVATWTVINVMKDISEQSGTETQSDMSEVDVALMYEMTPMLEAMPKEVITKAYEQALKTDGMLLNQSALVLTKAFYEELGVNLGNVQRDYIIKIGLLMLVIALVGGVSSILVNLCSARISSGVARDLRKDVFEKVESFSNSEFNQYSTASLITRTTNDVSQIQMLIGMGVRMICYSPMMVIGGVYMALQKSISMSWIIVLAVVCLLCLIGMVIFIAMPKFKIMQILVDKLNLVSRENLSGLLVIRAFGTQNHEVKKFEKANEDLAKTNLFVNRVMSAMFPLMGFVMSGTTLLVVWVGAHQIAESSMQIGDMMAFMQYCMQIIMSFLMISMMFMIVPRAAVSAERIAEVLATKATIIDPQEPKKIKNKKGEVLFKNVSFKYLGAEEYALEKLTFTARPGETTAIIGPTGSGKSTIANLLLRFYDVTEGEVFVDGINVKEILQYDLHEMIGYVPQKGELLSGTIASNIKYGKKNATEQEMIAAAKTAQAFSFIEEKEDKFRSEISQGGTNVSGGQRQRLSIARALAKTPEILIFDDSFSALDFKTDSILRKALQQDAAHATKIVIAQRVNTIMNAEQIIVLDEGKVVGIGTHKELLASCPAYYEIASSQLSKEELA